jgi:GTP-binding protein
MLVDEAFITVKGGHGGPGKVSFFPGYRTSPDGGDGGFGGSVIAKANSHMVSLERFTSQTKFSAENGQAGESFRRQGRNGKDLYLEFPVGTLLRDAQTKEEYELLKPDQEIVLVKGGKGGKGNDFFKSSTNVSPRQSQSGLEGQMRQFKLIMRLIADFGFIGLPNAGKSSLLNELTAANVKTANYPFTTLTPNLGSLYGTILADIPGLIEGAHEGKGLGSRFLKHIEKVKAVIHCVASDSEDIIKDYETIRHELSEFNPALAKKPEIVLLTKHDLKISAEIKKLITKMKKKNNDVYAVSIHDLDSLETLKKVIKSTE